MRNKKKIILLTATLLTLILIIFFQIFSLNNATNISIRNHTGIVISILSFGSIDNDKLYTILKIDPNEQVEFEYEIGGFNENAVYLKHLDVSYSIIGYVSDLYYNVNIDILSINSDKTLKLKGESISAFSNGQIEELNIMHK